MRLYGDGANSGLQEGRRRLLERSYRHRTHRLRSWLTPVFRPVPIDQRAQNDELKKTIEKDTQPESFGSAKWDC